MVVELNNAFCYNVFTYMTMQIEMTTLNQPCKFKVSFELLPPITPHYNVAITPSPY